VDLPTFDAPPQTLDEDVVAPGALAINADLDLSGGQHLDEVGGREPAALSVLNISGVPRFANASSTASMQKSASSVIDSRHARTRA
jgi:hypothetical protein